MDPITCIYHKDCVDGTTAAAVVLRKFPHAQCFPLSHQYASEEFAYVAECTDPSAQIFVVDATLGVKEFLARGHRVTVIDHHMSEQSRMLEMLPNEPRLKYVFSMEQSGASLTWATLFPNEPLPQLIAHVEDSDLWRHALGENTKHIAHYLSTYRNKPEYVATLLDGEVTAIIEKGKIISEYANTTIAQLTRIPSVFLRIGQHTVPTFNITDHQSACGNILATKHDCAVALFTILGDSVKFSFRCLPHHTPSSLDLALILGGGGHRNASGAAIPLAEFLARVTSTKTPPTRSLTERIQNFTRLFVE